MNSAEGLTETERQQYEDLEKTIADVNSNILSDTESTLNQITEAFNNEIEIIFKDLEERIAGVGNSIQDLADAYSYYQEEQSRYVTSARELYEVNKLNRQIEKTMNETSSKVNKNLLAALQDRINKQSELNDLHSSNILREICDGFKRADHNKGTIVYYNKLLNYEILDKNFLHRYQILFFQTILILSKQVRPEFQYSRHCSTHHLHL